jgi:acyl transferase domain-containing protein/NAD(P)-dependent dehydrogenase (short-subunit alcohol dehydrogenase family)/acyl carrier protein
VNKKSSQGREHDVPLAIIGISCIFPEADGLDAYWHNVRNGVDAITDLPDTHWSPDDFFDADPKAPDMTYASRGGFIPEVDFNPLEFGIAPNALEATDTAQLLGLYTASRALKDAGYGPDREFDRDRVSVVLGVTGTLELTISLGSRLGHPFWRKALAESGVTGEVAEDVVRRIADSYVGWQEASFPGLLGNVVAGRIANRLNLGGTNCVVDAACASSLSALHLAAMELAEGRCDMAITGGVDTLNDIFMYMCFSKTPALSATGNARPFDHEGDGTILGEGVGMLILKRLDDAVRDGDKIYAELRGLGTASDGKGNAIYAPSSSGQAKALRRAYQRAGMTPDTVEMVEAHGTGTVVGDAVESEALSAVYREGGAEGTWCAVGSVKSQIGHTKAAAGAASLIKTAMALHHKVLPPTLKVEKPLDQMAPGASPFYVNTDKRPWLASPDHPRRAGVSSFGFGGSNFHCVLQEHVGDGEVAVSEPDWDGDVQVLAFGATTQHKLKEWLTRLGEAEHWDAVRELGQVSRKAFSASDAERLLLVVERGHTDPSALATRAASLLDAHTESTWSTPDGVYYGRGAAAGDLALLFPGQGSQYVGMLRDLACQFPAVRSSLERANAVAPDANLGETVYPHPAFDDDARQLQEDALRDTCNAQPAIGAVSVGAHAVLRQFGVQPVATAGHSFGELTALFAAGRLSEDDFHALARLRGRIMGEQDGDRGAMLAVRAGVADVEKVIAAESLDLVMANRNAPAQVVLSGATSEIERAAAVLRVRQIDARRLPVSAAFHSPLVSDAEGPLAEALDSIEFMEGSVPVYANSTGSPYPDNAGEARALLAGQLARPVHWEELILNMHRDGVRSFVETGPHARLSGLVAAVLDGEPHHAFALDATHGSRSGVRDLARVLAQIGSLGHTIDLQPWDALFRPTPAPATTGRAALTYKVGGANIRTRKREPMQRNKTTAPSPAPAMATQPPVAHAQDAQPQVPNVGSPPPAIMPPPTAPVPTDTPFPVVASAMPGSVAEALRVTQENMAALQRLQQQTAQLHQQFLEGQNASQAHYHTLLQQQQRFLDLSMGLPVSAAPPVAVAASVAPQGVAPAIAPQPGFVAPAAPVTPVAPVAPVTPVAPVPPVAAQASPVVPTPAPAPGVDVAGILLEIVAEKTGYPVDVLDLTMELDADLGIDSIKRVEILSALQDALPNAPRVGPDQLGTLRTLQSLLDLMPGEGASEEIARSPEIADQPEATPDPVQDSDADVAKILLDIVADKTGYPVDVLELTMELDADLGIDSIKRVEILSALQDQLPSAPKVGPDQLGTLRTLQSLLDLIPGGSPTPTEKASKEESPVNETPATSEPVQHTRRPLQRFLLRSREFNGAPEKEAARPEQGASIWITDGDAELASQIVGLLTDTGYQPRIVSAGTLNGARDEAVAGVVILPSREDTSDADLFDALQVVQAAGNGLRTAGREGGAFLVSASRLDGAFGTSGGEIADPLTGGFAGLTKSAAHEWPEVRCRVLDLSPDLVVKDAAEAIVAEIFREGPLEVGLSVGGRSVLELVTEEPSRSDASLALGEGDLVVLSGGARGVTAEVALALAESFKPTLLLLGRSSEPEGEPEWLTGLETEAEIKQAILAGGMASTPRDAGALYSRIRGEREIRSNLERMRSTGATVLYRSVDVRDATAVSEALEPATAEYGSVRVLVHGAGVLADQHILDKTAENFQRVYQPKVAGLRNLLGAVDRDALRALVLFSSSTARYGRVGQVDYAIANEVLNKVAQQEAQRLPECRVVSLNWGPWEGGMVDESLRTVFAREGVPLIPLAQGAEHLLRELSTTDTDVERLVLGPAQSAAPSSNGSSGVVSGSTLPLVAEEQIDVASCGFLRSHVLDGKAVVPMAILPEWLAHGALHGNPGLKLHGCDNLRVLKGLVMDGEGGLRLKIHAGVAVKEDEGYRVPVELRAVHANGAEFLHARADILLTEKLPSDKPRLDDPQGPAYEKTAAETYRDHLFHGPDLQGIERVEICSPEGVIADASAAPSPGAWMTRPLRRRWLTDPLVLDVGIQLLTFWSGVHSAGPSLPCAVSSFRQFRAFPKAGVRIVARITQSDATRVVADMEFVDGDGRLVARLEGCENTVDEGLTSTFRSNHLPLEVSS